MAVLLVKLIAAVVGTVSGGTVALRCSSITSSLNGV